MPPGRCSNCGRFVNVVAGCQNPRCLGLGVSHVLPVKAPSRCSNCGRFMNAVVGCQNDRCRPPDRGSSLSDFPSNKVTIPREISPAIDPKSELKESVVSRELSRKIEYLAAKQSVLEIAGDELKQNGSRLDREIIANAKALERLESHCSRKLEQLEGAYKKLEETSAEFALALRTVRAEFQRVEKIIGDISSANDGNNATAKSSLALFVSEQKSAIGDLTGRLKALENRHTEVEFCAARLDQKSITAADTIKKLEFFGDEKYRVLVMACSEHRTSLVRMAAEHGELVAENASLLNEQNELRRRLVRTEDALEEQRSLISTLPEWQDKNTIAIITALANALDLELNLGEIDGEISSGRETVSEVSRAGSAKVTSERLVKAIVSEMRNKREKNSRGISPRYMYAIAGIAFSVNFLCIGLLCRKVHI